MSDEATTAAEETAGSDGHGHRDRSPREANRAQAAQRAEVSNYDIVNHWFTLAADRLEIAEDIRAVLSSSYREVQVQIPASLSDGKIHVFGGRAARSGGLMQTHEVYDAATRTWTDAAPLPTGRSGMMATVYRGRLHVLEQSVDERRLSVPPGDD